MLQPLCDPSILTHGPFSCLAVTKCIPNHPSMTSYIISTFSFLGKERHIFVIYIVYVKPKNCPYSFCNASNWAKTLSGFLRVKLFVSMLLGKWLFTECIFTKRAIGR